MKKINKEYFFIAVLFVCFILLTFFVVNGYMNSLDKFAFNNIIKIKNDVTTSILYVITQLASTKGIIILLFIIGILFLVRKYFSDFKYVIVNVSIGVILMQVLKNIIERSRPSWKWIVQGGFSYPSGHTISALLLYGTLILLVLKKVNGKYKKLLVALFSIMIVLTGISRIYFGAHYLTDVLASLILGTIILIITNMIMNKEFKNDKNKGNKTIQTR